MVNIRIERCTTSQMRAKPTDPKKLGFGRYFTDHTFLCEYNPADGWHNARIEASRELTLSPAAMVLHYGQEAFEGLKAYYGKDDAVYLFRWRKNAERMQRSAERLIMQAPAIEMFGEGIKQLVKLDRDWIPRTEGCSLYIRPTLIATDPFLGVRPSETYLFYVVCSPVGAYYSSGFGPTKIQASETDVRACPGGLGEAKTSGNYAASMRAQMKAKQQGYNQVLWLDAVERKYCEEVGTSNIFFKIKGKVITPPLLGTILPGVTRDSTIQILKSWNIPVEERRISIDEVIDAHTSGDLEEVFGTGTAAVVSPVGLLAYREKEYEIGGMKTGELAQRLYSYLTRLQTGFEDDPFGWREQIDKFPAAQTSVAPAAG